MERFKESGLSKRETGAVDHCKWLDARPCNRSDRFSNAPQLTLETAGWSAARKATSRSSDRYCGGEAEELQQYKGKLKGAIVLVGRPREMVSPGHPLLTPWGKETIPCGDAEVGRSQTI